MQNEIESFLSLYLSEYKTLENKKTLAYWKAANSGDPKDFGEYAKSDVALKTFHSDKSKYEKIIDLLNAKGSISELHKRSLEVALLAFKGNQISKSLIDEMVSAQSEIELKFNTYRAEYNGKKLSNNDLLDALKNEKNLVERKAMWEALKQVGAEVSSKLTALAEVRNKAALELGYSNFWEMQIRLEEHDPSHLEKLFSDLERLTDEPYREAKRKIDTETSARLGVLDGNIFPWHYDNPFFQDAPPSSLFDADSFYSHMKREDIMNIAVKFFNDFGIAGDSVVAGSDLYERDGKDQHAFCITIDRAQDVRMLLNIRPDSEWMDTSLHELGHGVFYVHIDPTLPFNLREANHIFVTEAIAMLFGAQAGDPDWIIKYTKADPQKVEPFREAMKEQRRREQLVFARWTLVMFNFERELYRNPKQDLNRLWWDHAERFQLLSRPENRNAPDWAAKPHFTIAPVYYHNYMLGEIFAAQLRNKAIQTFKGASSIANMPDNQKIEYGEFLKKQIFKPGMSTPWPKFVEQAMGEPLSIKYFVNEVF